MAVFDYSNKPLPMNFVFENDDNTKLEDMLSVSDYVQVLFTVNSYRNTKESCIQFNTALPFNIQKVIVLTRAEKQYMGEQLNTEDHDLGSVDVSKLLPVEESTEDGLLDDGSMDSSRGPVEKPRYL